MRTYLRILSLTVSCLLLLYTVAFAKGDTLTVITNTSFKNLDPHSTTSSSPHLVTFHIHESLVELDKDDNVMPLLAERWETLDPQTYKFYLKKGVKFHNGEVMTADDVVYSFKRAMTAGGVRAFSSIIANVEKVDDHTVILKTSLPIGTPFLLSLSHPWASIMSAKATEAAGKDYGQKPVGTGRFIIASWPGDRIHLDRFEDYHGTKAPLKHLIIRTVTEHATRTIELETGAVDLIIDIPPADVGRVKDNPALEVVSKPSLRMYYVGFDITKPPYDNPKVRQAVNIAIDREGICKAVYRGNALPARGPLTSATPYNKYKTSPPIKRDIVKAKQLLKEAGFPNGFKMRFMCPDRTEYLNQATVVQANLREIGIDVELDVSEWGTFYDLIRQKGHEPFIQTWWGTPPANDPYFLLAPFHSVNIGVSNRLWYKNQEVDDLLDRGMALSNGPEREQVYGRVWDIVNEEVPWASLLEVVQHYGHAKGLKGIIFRNSYLNYFGRAYFE